MAEDEKISQPGEDAQAPSPKRKAKRGWIIGGVVAAVIVVAGAGFWVWHETPSFCNAICHSPMDSYVDTYYSGDQGMLVTSDDYPMTADGTKLADGADMASEEFCAKSGCHDMDDVVASTWGFEGNGEQFNPHSSHQDLALECGDCHKAHEKSVLMCNQCHKLNMPEGWEAPNAA